MSVIFSAAPVIRAYAAAKRWIDYATGAVFVGLGLRLAAR